MICRLTIGVFVATALHAQPVVSARAGLLYHVEGSVQAAGVPVDPDSLQLHQLEPGDRLETRRGFAELSLGPGRTLRVAPGTLVELVRDDINAAAARLYRGAVIVDWVPGPRGAAVEIQAGDAAVELLRNGLYRVDLRGASTRLRVFGGKARVADGSSLGRGRQILLHGESVGPARFDPERRDPFDRWSARRARVAARMARAGTKRRRRGRRGIDASQRGAGRERREVRPF